MLEEMKYVCEKCGASYNTEQKALSCEASHIEATSMTSFKFSPKEKYPSMVICEMSDGEQILYKKN